MFSLSHTRCTVMYTLAPTLACACSLAPDSGRLYLLCGFLRQPQEETAPSVCVHRRAAHKASTWELHATKYCSILCKVNLSQLKPRHFLHFTKTNQDRGVRVMSWENRMFGHPNKMMISESALLGMHMNTYETGSVRVLEILQNACISMLFSRPE